MTLPAASPSAGMARSIARTALTGWGLGHLEETVVLLVSELVTNSVRHARNNGSALELRLETAGAWLRIEMLDADPRPPEPQAPTDLDESGFGFVLIEALAGKWGVRETVTGKAVWIEMDTEKADDTGTG